MYWHRQPCDAVVAEFIFGPQRCNKRWTRKIKVNTGYGIVEEFYTCRKHDPERKGKR